MRGCGRFLLLPPFVGRVFAHLQLQQQQQLHFIRCASHTARMITLFAVSASVHMSKVSELPLSPFLSHSLYLSLSQGASGKASRVAQLNHLSIFGSSKFKEQKTMRMIKLNRLQRCRCKLDAVPSLARHCASLSLCTADSS